MNDLRRSALYTTNAIVPNTHGFHKDKDKHGPELFLDKNQTSQHPQRLRQTKQNKNSCSTPPPAVET